ncbi:hypothetical protein JCM3765_001558 [Sporobolomyces pararoseus]
MGNNQSSSSHHHHHGGSTSGGGGGGSSSSMMKPSGSTSSLRSRSSTLDSNSRTMIDGGFLEPQSLLYSHVEYHRPTVHKLIIDHKLSPFYLGLNDFEEEWDLEEIVKALGEAEQQATQNLKDALNAAIESVTEVEAAQLNAPTGTRKHKEVTQQLSLAILRKERLAEMIKIRDKRGGGGLQWTSKSDQAKLYKERALECPICFLYYPPNMVHTRCCDQPICTECFVQIKRAEPTPTHLESEPAACPFCMEPNFGCVYEKPTPSRPTVQQVNSGNSGSSEEATPVQKSPKPRRKSFAHTEKDVVTTDMLHPDWETKLEAMKATVARRANRRIVFRQVGDRLVPVGITSGRSSDGANATMATGGGTQTLPPDFLSQIAAALDQSNNSSNNESQSSSGGRSGFRVRSSRRRGGSSSGGGGDGNDEVARLLESLGLGGGPDLEEMMLQEAMRLSQLEEEERQKKVKAEEEAKKLKEQQKNAGGGAAAVASTSSTSDSRRTSTERELSEAMGGSVASLPQPTTTTFPGPSTSKSTSAALDPISPPKSSINTTSLPPPSQVDSDQMKTPTASSTPPTNSTTFPSSTAPTLPPIATSTASTTEFDPLGPSVSRASETSSFVVDTSGGYQQLGDESDADGEATAASTSAASREGTGGGGGGGNTSGQLIDI